MPGRFLCVLPGLGAQRDILKKQDRAGSATVIAAPDFPEPDFPEPDFPALVQDLDPEQSGQAASSSLHCAVTGRLGRESGPSGSASAASIRHKIIQDC